LTSYLLKILCEGNKIEENQLYWCKECYIPVLENFCKNCNQICIPINKRLKFVFDKEYERYKSIYLSSLNENQNDLNYFPSILYRRRNYLISDISNGKNHFRLSIRQTSNEDAEVGDLKLEIYRIFKDTSRSDFKSNDYFLYDEEYLSNLIYANEDALIKLENEALEFIQKVNKKYNDYKKVISFSGGKDSMVTAYLVKQIIDDAEIIFSNTRIEYPETIKFVEDCKSFFGDITVVESKNDFFKMCDLLGPPSRMMRWCCSTQKAGPVNNYYASLNHKKILSFDGIRREESNLRSNYPREKDNTKLIKQFSVYPILNWSEIEVWLYIFWKNLPYNPLYREGFSRIGCFPCPNNSLYDVYLFQEIHPELYRMWINKLDTYRIDQQIKIEKEVNYNFYGSTKNYQSTWIDDGAWKSRRVKYHDTILLTQNYKTNTELNEFTGFDDNFNEKIDENLDENINDSFSPCGKHSFLFTLNTPFNEHSVEFFKVFGKIERFKIKNDETIRINGKDLYLTFQIGKNILKFEIFDANKTKDLLIFIKRQINKAFNCINCGACIGSCPHGAIEVNNHFKINQEKCKNCYICCGTKYLKFSCVALHYKENRNLIKLK